jgi:hypothetical protein
LSLYFQKPVISVLIVERAVEVGSAGPIKHIVNRYQAPLHVLHIADLTYYIPDYASVLLGVVLVQLHVGDKVVGELAGGRPECIGQANGGVDNICRCGQLAGWCFCSPI